MGRGAKPPGVDPGRAQGTLLGFLSRAPLAPADANEERPLRSARVEKAGDGHASAGAGEKCIAYFALSVRVLRFASIV